jgi:hypothetical protein
LVVDAAGKGYVVEKGTFICSALYD